MMNRLLSLALAVLLMASRAQCFTTSSTSITSTYNSQTTRLHAAEENSGGVQLVSLESLGDDHEAVGENMGKSLAAWLDDEWMPQEIHIKMGISVKNTYVQCRTKQ